MLRVQELCESRGGRSGLLMGLTVSVEGKATLNHAHALVSLSLSCQPTSEGIKLYIIIRLSVPFMVSVDVKHHVYLLLSEFRGQELCESRGGRPGLPVPNTNSPYGL